MIQCPKCSADNSDDSRFCKSCAEPLSARSQMPTATSPVAEVLKPAETPHVARIVSSDSIPAGGFTPGTILADRYRIIGLIGRGGMGEVYRADDLKLGQPVALKFLPKALADDSVRRERLFAEVRIARQVSHPNICRVYDISEFEGRHFLTMEYIDGEDLASLLKRIGSLHGAKALDVARQLCAGLAAAHDKGVLHRDLKPANVMIDGRGRVRITDFGLAVAADEEVNDADVSGTPPYMAPEQFAGKGASVRSDIYALGLIFYEVFTGRRAFDAKTLAELRSKKETSSPTAPSEIARDIDPIVERVILRCIEKDPRQRPASAAQVAAALPGRDPLAAAIAAGETPSPEMVAASGSDEGLKPWIAWVCLALIIFGLGALVAIERRFDSNIMNSISMEKPPEVLAQTARDILSDVGYTDPAADSAFGFISAGKYLDYVEKNDRSPNRFEKLPSFLIQFWYRQSPLILFHRGPSSGVTRTDPPFTNNGESIVWLDPRGRLTGLRVIPQNNKKESGPVQQPDWSALFKRAGLDKAEYTSVEPESIPPVFADTQAAWTGKLPDFPDTVVRIEAAAYRGKPVVWELIVPSWDNYSTAALPSVQLLPGTGNKVGDIIGAIVAILLLVVGPAVFARRNLRLGRGDRSGAFRLASFAAILMGIAWIFREHHVAAISEMDLFFLSAEQWLLIAGWLWLIYIALEPYARRRWPEALVGWNRLLAGKFRDPLVGRDLLCGLLVNVLTGLAVYGLSTPLSHLLNTPQSRPSIPTLGLFAGAHIVIAATLESVLGLSVFVGLALAFVIFILRFLFRSTWAAVAVSIVALSLLVAMSSIPDAVAIALIAGAIFFLFLRFGLLSLIAGCFVALVYSAFPLTAWNTGVGLTGLALLLAFALYAFHTSLGGQPIFGRASLED
jgi:serine/threonine protein kinase